MQILLISIYPLRDFFVSYIVCNLVSSFSLSFSLNHSFKIFDPGNLFANLKNLRNIISDCFFFLNLIHWISGNGVETRILNVNNATFTYPSSPLLSQGGDVSGETMCYSTPDEDDARVENNETASLSSRRCRRSDATASNVCECVHVRYIPLGATVEIILLDQGNLTFDNSSPHLCNTNLIFPFISLDIFQSDWILLFRRYERFLIGSIRSFFSIKVTKLSTTLFFDNSTINYLYYSKDSAMFPFYIIRYFSKRLDFIK